MVFSGGAASAPRSVFDSVIGWMFRIDPVALASPQPWLDALSQSAFATDASGEVLPTTLLYWFAWYAFHPQTLVFEAP